MCVCTKMEQGDTHTRDIRMNRHYNKYRMCSRFLIQIKCQRYEENFWNKTYDDDDDTKYAVCNVRCILWKCLVKSRIESFLVGISSLIPNQVSCYVCVLRLVIIWYHASKKRLNDVGREKQTKIIIIIHEYDCHVHASRALFLFIHYYEQRGWCDT